MNGAATDATAVTDAMVVAMVAAMPPPRPVGATPRVARRALQLAGAAASPASLPPSPSQKATHWRRRQLCCSLPTYQRTLASAKLAVRTQQLASMHCTRIHLSACTDIFRNFHGFKSVSMRFKARDEKLYREDRSNRPVTFIHFETLEDATVALQARQGYVVDPANADNTSVALNYSSKFNPENKKTDTQGDDAGDTPAAGDAAPGAAAVVGDESAPSAPVADVADQPDADDATDTQLENSAESGSPDEAAQPAADSALAGEGAAAKETADDVLDYDEDEDVEA